MSPIKHIGTALPTNIKKIKKIRLHSEGRTTLWLAFAALALLCLLVWLAFGGSEPVVCYVVGGASVALYAVLVNFFRCPYRQFPSQSEGVVVAAADGRVVVVEEVEETEYFHDRRIMVSIFMSVTNVHANWFPVEGTVRLVQHHQGNFHKAWLPKASTENERSTVVIETPQGQQVLVRQIAGAVARRIVTYAHEGDECFLDEHMGFIKFGSRVDVYLPLTAQVLVRQGQRTVGNQTVVARLRF